MRHTLRPSLVLLTMAMLHPCFGQGGSSAPAPPQDPLDPVAQLATGPYQVLDNVEGPWINLNIASVRPLLVMPASGDIVAVNTHDSTVEVFTPGQASPREIYPVPWGPVSIALWETGEGIADELLVVCRGSYTLARLDAASGEILRLLTLPAEPGDILVDDVRKTAYISCSAVDTVVEVDLPGNTISRRWSEVSHPSFRMKNPLFLSFDESRGATARRILVAPLLSGNNSTSRGNELPNATGNVVDLADPAVAVTGLPDEDLFLIDPASDTVKPVARAMGTILFAHGVHPGTGDFWQLNTDAINKDPSLQSEPLVNGIFATNRITVIDDLLSAPGGVSEPDPQTDFRVLDPGGLGGNITAANPVGQPYAMAFHGGGHVFVGGLLTRAIVELDAGGAFVKSWRLPLGAIVRALVLDDAEQTLYAYCWGTNEVIAYDHGAPAPVPLVRHALNHDPTPRLIRGGRRLFYDARFSANENLSCATCHIEGRTDLLAWNLSNLPLDDKGPMVTQTLAGINRMAPFHWRGERPGLAEFNPAFVGLLGNDSPLSTEGANSPFEQFERFVLSIENPANPNADRERRLNQAIPTPVSPEGQTVIPDPDPVDGQDLYFNEIVFQSEFTCNACHQAPTGTGNDNFPIFNLRRRPRRTFFKPAPFHEIWRKQMSLVEIEFVNPIGTQTKFERSYLGAGFSHTGQLPDLFRFIGLFGLGSPRHENITAFVHQWDSGLAPAVHFAFLLNAQSAGQATSELRNYLQAQALVRNCDIVVFGTSVIGGSPVKTRWFWDRQSNLYRAEDPAVTPRTLTDFTANAASESNVFLGLPVGTGERFGIDYDFDGVPNAADPLPYRIAGPDASDLTAPGMFKQPDTTFTTTKVARLSWETDEPSTAVVRYREAGSGQHLRTVTLSQPAKAQSVMLAQLRPSTASDGQDYDPETVTYEWEVTVTDRSGRSATFQAPNFDTEPFIERTLFNGPPSVALFQGQSIVRGLAMDPMIDLGGGLYRFRAAATASLKKGGVPAAVPAPSRAMAVNVLIKLAGTDEWVLADTTAHPITAINGTVLVDTLTLSYAGPPPPPNPSSIDMFGDGPYLIAPLTDASFGATTFEFEMGGLSSGDEVMVNVRAVTEIPAGLVPAYLAQINGPTPMILTDDARLFSFLQWSFSDTGEDRSNESQTVP